MQGAKAHSAPAPAISTAVVWATFSTRAGSRVQPRPMLWGKITAPSTPPSPWTASVPYKMGMARRVASAAAEIRPSPSAQVRGSLGEGREFPPFRIEPR